MESIKYGFRWSLLGLFLGCGGADNSIANGTFNEWCKDNPCEFTVEEGSVEKVDTWHKGEWGVSMSSTTARISQLLTTDLTHRCVRIELVAYNEPDSNLEIAVDVENDQIIDAVEKVPGLNWESYPVFWSFPVSGKDTRLIVQKSGAGHVVLARLYIEANQTLSGCTQVLVSQALTAPNK